MLYAWTYSHHSLRKMETTNGMTMRPVMMTLAAVTWDNLPITKFGVTKDGPMNSTSPFWQPCLTEKFAKVSFVVAQSIHRIRSVLQLMELTLCSMTKFPTPCRIWAFLLARLRSPKLGSPLIHLRFSQLNPPSVYHLQIKRAYFRSPLVANLH